MSREAWQAEWHPLVEAVDLPMVPNYPSVRERQVTWIGAFRAAPAPAPIEGRARVVSVHVMRCTLQGLPMLRLVSSEYQRQMINVLVPKQESPSHAQCSPSRRTGSCVAAQPCMLANLPLSRATFGSVCVGEGCCAGLVARRTTRCHDGGRKARCEWRKRFRVCNKVGCSRADWAYFKMLGRPGAAPTSALNGAF